MKINKISALIRQIAEAEIMPRFKNLREDEVLFKESGDFVTAADLAAEYALTDGLKALYPKAVITGEEDIAKNPMRLVELLGSDCGFLIDPIDGTNNYIKGNDRFAVMAVALRFGEVAASWIYIPVSQRMAVAEKGSGAYINDMPARLFRAPKKISDMVGAAQLNRMPDKLKNIARKNIKLFRQNKPAFCAGYDYVALTAGQRDFSAYYKTLLWDHLPGTLLFSEAGGYVASLDGKAYSAQSDGEGLLCANDEDQWHLIRQALFS